MAIYVWKILEGSVTNNGGITAEWTDYKGRKVKLPKLQGRQAVKTLREASFSVRGAKIFN